MKKIICETGSGMKKFIIGWRACQLNDEKIKWGWKVAKLILILLVIKLFIGMIVGLVVMVRHNKLVDRPEKQTEIILPAVNVPEVESFTMISGATIYAYNSVVGQTDDTPFMTANGKKVYNGLIANNCLEFGTKVEYHDRIYTVDDRMNDRYGKWENGKFCVDGKCYKDCMGAPLVFDIWMASHIMADDFGVRKNVTIKIIL